MKKYAAHVKTPIGNLFVEDVFAENPTKAIEFVYFIIESVMENADIEIQFISNETEEE